MYVPAVYVPCLQLRDLVDYICSSLKTLTARQRQTLEDLDIACSPT